jgi:hypothetical protein
MAHKGKYGRRSRSRALLFAECLRQKKNSRGVMISELGMTFAVAEYQTITAPEPPFPGVVPNAPPPPPPVYTVPFTAAVFCTENPVTLLEPAPPPPEPPGVTRVPVIAVFEAPPPPPPK